MNGVVGSTVVEWWRPAATAASGRAATAAPAPDSPAPFAALLAFIVILLLAPAAVVPGLGRVPIALFIGVIAIGTHCWTRVAAGRPLARGTRETRLVGAVFAWAIVTLPLSLWPAGSMQILLGDFLKALGVFWLVSNTVSTSARLRAVAWVLSLTAVPLAASGVSHFFSHTMVAGRIAGYSSFLALIDAPLAADANTLALVLNLILPLTVGLFLLNRRRMVRGVLAGLIALDVSAIVVTFSRGGFLTLAATFVLFLRTFQRQGKLGWAMAALLLAVAAIPLLPSGYLDRLSTIGNIEGDTTGSAQVRSDLTRIGLEYTLSHPLLGAGLGMNVIAACALREGGPRGENCGRFCYRIPPLFPPCLYVHNVYLEYGMDLGWIGLGLYLLLIVSCIGTAARVRERCAGLPGLGELPPLAEGIRIAIVAFAVAALFYPWAYSVYFYFAAALAVAAGAVYDAEAHAAAGMLVSAQVATGRKG